jgi:hypothetical protein
MTYLNQWHLTFNNDFVSRCRAALTNQASVFKDDGRTDVAALAEAILMGSPTAVFITWQNLLAASPDFVEIATNPDGTIDSSNIDDANILAAIQAQWPTVADLYFNSDGTPKG